MKTYDLADRPSDRKSVSPSKEVWYPGLSFEDDGVGGVASFDDEDIGRTIRAQVDMKLTEIGSDSNRKKKYRYRFEVRKLHMPDDLSAQEVSARKTKVVSAALTKKNK
ncbi:hypothetical protein LCGC14_0476120 [marine sediment metagenome]|uniref:Uncharacterized protein n=1 Tax=marine sediment metagenome TaxID=412755 RepID=A0A0F9SAU6_9ZZZZ